MRYAIPSSCNLFWCEILILDGVDSVSVFFLLTEILQNIENGKGKPKRNKIRIRPEFLFYGKTSGIMFVWPSQQFSTIKI